MRQINGTGISTNVSTPTFTTAEGDGPDAVIWLQLLPPYAYGWVLWSLWLALLLVGIWVQQSWAWTSGARKLQDKVEQTLINVDPEPIEYYDPYEDDFAEQGEAKGGLFLFALLIFLIIAYIFIIVFFASYTQYNGTNEDIPNNIRTSSLRPYFSAPPSHRQLLDWFVQQGFGMTVALSGFTFADCQNLCNSRSVESAGCFYSGSARPCSESPALTCRLVGSDTCQIRWVLPPAIELTSTSIFKFNIGNAFLQELDITLDMPGQPGLTSNFSEVSQSLDTVELRPGFSNDKVQLPASSLTEQILFGVERQYELNYVLLSSEKPGFSYQGVDWKMQTVFLPLQSNVITGTLSYSKYYCASLCS